MNPAWALTAVRRKIQSWRDRRIAAAFLDPGELSRIHILNHATLSKIPAWISDETRRNSVFQYGVPDAIRHLIDCDVGSGITYTDALVVLAGRLAKQARYLEIGVSVGKNFWQMTQRLTEADLVGLDIEEINPVLRRRLQPGARRVWPTMEGSLKKKDSSLTEYAVAGSSNRLRYLSGDVFDDASWAQLGGEKFNLVFSDAFHSADALMREYGMLTRHELLDEEELVMVWDDLGGEMLRAFKEICRRLSRTRSGSRSTSFIVPLKGWLGDNWGDHSVGFFISRHG